MLDVVCCESEFCFSLSLEGRTQGLCHIGSKMEQLWTFRFEGIFNFSSQELGEVKLGRDMNLPSVKVIYLQASKRKGTVEFFKIKKPQIKIFEVLWFSWNEEKCRQKTKFGVHHLSLWWTGVGKWMPKDQFWCAIFYMPQELRMVLTFLKIKRRIFHDMWQLYAIKCP